MRVECYGATLAQDGRQRTANQDAFTIVRVPVVTAVVCDGAGNAQLAARRVTGLFDLWLAETTLGQVLATDPWSRWVRLADSMLLGGSECTLAAIQIVGSEARGVVVGDSRIYLLPEDGGCRLLAEPLSKARLGSGEVVPTLVRHQMAPHDILLLLTDGAWTPLGPVRLERAARKAALVHFSDVPSAILEAAGLRGRADDMTAVAVRLASH
jgi:serine/threonine protein phosphatase PrpC